MIVIPVKVLVTFLLRNDEMTDEQLLKLYNAVEYTRAMIFAMIHSNTKPLMTDELAQDPTNPPVDAL